MRRRLREGAESATASNKKEKQKTQKGQFVPNLSFHACVAFGGKNIFVSFGSFFCKKGHKNM